MPIYVQLSVDPHSKKVRWDPKTLEPMPDSRPPHNIIKKTFDTVAEARAFVDNLGMKLYGWKDEYWDEWAKDPQWWDNEIEVMELTGQEFTKACLHLEGSERT